MEPTPELTFKALNERIDALPEHPSMTAGPSRTEKYGYAIALSAYALHLLSTKLIADKVWSLGIATFFAVVELAAVIAIFAAKWPPRLYGFRADRHEYAEQLDHDHTHYVALVQWIAGFPRDQIAALSDYAELRQERFRERQPLLLGSVEKLGVLPVLVAIYAQFKGLHFKITWVEALSLAFLAWVYWLCLISIGTRYRGQFYAIVLKRALIAKEQEAGPGNTPDLAPKPTITAPPAPHSTDRYTSGSPAAASHRATAAGSPG